MGWDHRIEDPSLAYVNGLRSPEIDGNLDDDPSQLDRVLCMATNDNGWNIGARKIGATSFVMCCIDNPAHTTSISSSLHRDNDKHDFLHPIQIY